MSKFGTHISIFCTVDWKFQICLTDCSLSFVIFYIWIRIILMGQDFSSHAFLIFATLVNFLLPWQTIWKKLLTEGRINYGSQFECTVHHLKLIWLPYKGGRHIASIVLKQRERNQVLTHFPLLFSVHIPHLQWCCHTCSPHFFSHSNWLNLDICHRHH